MAVPARLSLATLGVTDLARSTAFYRALGWPLSPASQDGISFFRTAGGLLALYPLDDLAADAGSEPAPAAGFHGVALAINVDEAEQVDACLGEAVAAGATLLKPAATAEWGGRSGYFADPDGHAWEVAHNPGWPIGPDGRPQMP
jgi:hypothetical protein